MIVYIVCDVCIVFSQKTIHTHHITPVTWELFKSKISISLSHFCRDWGIFFFSSVFKLLIHGEGGQDETSDYRNQNLFQHWVQISKNRVHSSNRKETPYVRQKLTCNKYIQGSTLKLLLFVAFCTWVRKQVCVNTLSLSLSLTHTHILHPDISEGFKGLLNVGYLLWDEGRGAISILRAFLCTNVPVSAKLGLQCGNVKARSLMHRRHKQKAVSNLLFFFFFKHKVLAQARAGDLDLVKMKAYLSLVERD